MQARNGGSLGEAIWAQYMPYENCADLAEGKLSEDKLRFVREQFALPIERALEVAREDREAPCRLINRQLVFDLQGNLLPCCTIYDLGKHVLGSFLEMTPAQVKAAKAKASVCTRCMKHGLHRYATYTEEEEMSATYDALARENLARLGPLPVSLPFIPSGVLGSHR